MQLIDTHAHLDEEAFDLDRDQVVARAVKSGLSAIVTIGTTAESSRQAVKLAQAHRIVFATIGIQPNYVTEAKPCDWEVIEQLVTQPKVVAIGETGLDRYRDYTPFEQQIEYFKRHIELSRTHDLPFVVHCRDAESDVVSALRTAAEMGTLRGVMHSYTGDMQMVCECLNLGLFISFAGIVTFKKSEELRAVAAQIPLDRLLVETDAPYLAPMPHRGKRNEPCHVRHTCECLARVHGITLEEMAAQTAKNARELFGLVAPASVP